MTARPTCQVCHLPDCMVVLGVDLVRTAFANLCLAAIRADRDWAVRVARIASMDGTR